MPHPPIRIGDAVVPAADPSHPVMTVFDIDDDLAVAHCNWLVGDTRRMVRVAHTAERLVRVPRPVMARPR